MTKEFLSVDDMQKLESFLNSNPERIEIEARIGEFRKGFKPGVNMSTFTHIQNSLARLTPEKGGSLEVTTSNTKAYSAGEFMMIEDLEFRDMPPFYRKKERKGVIDVPEWGYRISKAYEENLRSDDVKNIEFPKNTYRIKRRTSFNDRSQDGIFYGVQIDLTVVTHYDKGNAYETFEVELERKDKNLTSQKFLEMIKAIQFICQQLDKLYFTDFYKNPDDFDLAKKILKKRQELIMSTSQRSFAINNFNNIFGVRGKDKLALHRNEPVNIKIENLLDTSDYAVTSKLDGVRKFLFIDTNATYLVNPPFDIVQIPNIDSSVTVLDGELIDANTFYAFDVVFVGGRKITNKPLNQRLESLQSIKHKMIKTKKFHMSGDFYKDVKNALNDNEKFEEKGQKTDGLIIQAIKQPYVNQSTFKWKPIENLTIDFKVVHSSGNKYFLQSTGEKKIQKITEADVEKIKMLKHKTVEQKVVVVKELQRFKGTKKHPYNGTVTFEQGKFQNEKVDSRILEFVWNGKEFEAVRFRDDRPFPNRTDVAISIWNDINNPIHESTIRGEDFVVMRRFHNQIKRWMLEKYTIKGSSLLDIGSGRGGDLSKWSNQHLKVWAVEPDTENLKELKKRKEAMGYEDVNVINSGAEDTKKILKSVKNVDTIAAFFSLTFFGSNEEMMDGLVETIDRVLRKGGKFIGAVLDGEAVKDKADIETEAFSIKKKGHWSDKPFGNKIVTNINDPTSMVKDVEEYLFDFDVFEEKLEKIGVVLEKTHAHKFIDTGIDFLPKDAQVFSKLNRVFVFSRKQKLNIAEPVIILPADSSKPFVNDFDLELTRHSVISDSSVLFHAIVQTFSKKYLEAEDKVNFVDKVRKKFAHTLELEEYSKLGSGSLSDKLTKDYEKVVVNKDDAKNVGHAKMKQLLGNYEEWMGDTLELIQFISDRLNIDIYFINSSTRLPYVPEGEKKMSEQARCDILYKNRKSIVLLNINDLHYEVISENGKTIFKPDHPVIQAISCSKEKGPGYVLPGKQFSQLLKNSESKKKLFSVIKKKFNDVDEDTLHEIVESGKSDQEIYEMLKTHTSNEALGTGAWSQYDKKAAVGRAMSRVNDLKRWITESPKTYLDFGAGDCEITSAMKKSFKIPKVVAIDTRVNCSQEILKNIEHIVVSSDEKKIPVGTGEFDLVSCFQTLHHVENIESKLKEFSRIVKKGGLLVIREHNVNDPSVNMLVDIEHMIYDVTKKGVSFDEAKKEYPLFAHSASEWDVLFGAHGFKPVGKFEPRMRSNPTNHYYAAYKKQ